MNWMSAAIQTQEVTSLLKWFGLCRHARCSRAGNSRRSRSWKHTSSSQSQRQKERNERLVETGTRLLSLTLLWDAPVNEIPLIQEKLPGFEPLRNHWRSQRFDHQGGVMKNTKTPPVESLYWSINRWWWCSSSSQATPVFTQRHTQGCDTNTFPVTALFNCVTATDHTTRMEQWWGCDEKKV